MRAGVGPRLVASAWTSWAMFLLTDLVRYLVSLKGVKVINP